MSFRNNRATRRVINGRTEFFCNCDLRLSVLTSTTQTNPGKRFVKCGVCKVYEFLDEDLPSEYYQNLVFTLLQRERQFNSTVDYQKAIDALALDKSILEEELNDRKSKMKLYERLFFIMLGSFAVVCVGLGMVIGK